MKNITSLKQNMVKLRLAHADAKTQTAVYIKQFEKRNGHKPKSNKDLPPSYDRIKHYADAIAKTSVKMALLDRELAALTEMESLKAAVVSAESQLADTMKQLTWMSDSPQKEKLLQDCTGRVVRSNAELLEFVLPKVVHMNLRKEKIAENLSHMQDTLAQTSNVDTYNKKREQHIQLLNDCMLKMKNMIEECPDIGVLSASGTSLREHLQVLTCSLTTMNSKVLVRMCS